MNALDLLIRAADSLLAHPEHLQAGHNGPYGVPETSLRNTGHWLILLSNVFRYTGHEPYRRRAEELAEQLLRPEYRPAGYAFAHFVQAGGRQCNGVIGAAWTFEALVAATRLTGDRRYVAAGLETCRAYRFDPSVGLWWVLEVEGASCQLDLTFNHQLWFAACAAELGADQPDIRKQVDAFLDHLTDNMTVLPDGLIYHPIENFPAHLVGAQPARKLKRLGLRWWDKSKARLSGQPARPAAMIAKSIGYHCFNTHALGILHSCRPDHPAWSGEALQRVKRYLLSDSYRQGVQDNTFSYGYNAPGFEVPYSLYALNVLDDDAWSETSAWWLNEQVNRTSDPSTGLFTRNTPDPATLSARLYELSRLPAESLETVRLSI